MIIGGIAPMPTTSFPHGIVHTYFYLRYDNALVIEDVD